MYVLVVTFYRTVAPTLMPATIEGVMSCATTLEDVPMAASKDADALEKEADGIKERFSG